MSRSRRIALSAVLIAGVFGASWYATTVFPIVATAKAATEAVPPIELLRADAAVVQVAPAAAVVVLDDDQGSTVISPRPITPENPIPRRTRGVAPVAPPQYGSAQIEVSARVTVDRNGAVTSVDADSCSASGRTDGASICAAFHNAATAAIRQWRYDRPAQAPIQFYVRATFRSDQQTAIAQSAESYRRDLQDVERSVAEQERRDRAATDALLRAQLAELSARYREVERAQRLALERGSANAELLELQRQLAAANDAAARVQREFQDGSLRRSEGQAAGDPERLRRVMEQLREADRQLEASRADIAARTREAERALEAARARMLAERGLIAPADAARLSAQQSIERPMLTPSGRGPIRIADVPGLKGPAVTKRVHPEHPLIARQARVEGTVILEALVDEQGRVADARVIKSIPLLDRAALDAAKQWEFTPTLINGEPVPVLVQLEMEFNLR